MIIISLEEGFFFHRIKIGRWVVRFGLGWNQSLLKSVSKSSKSRKISRERERLLPLDIVERSLSRLLKGVESCCNAMQHDFLCYKRRPKGKRISPWGGGVGLESF